MVFYFIILWVFLEANETAHAVNFWTKRLMQLDSWEQISASMLHFYLLFVNQGVNGEWTSKQRVPFYSSSKGASLSYRMFDAAEAKSAYELEALDAIADFESDFFLPSLSICDTFVHVYKGKSG